MLNAPTWALWVGLTGSLLSGFCLRWGANARRFEGRTPLGIEIYKSYGHLMSSRVVEGLATVAANVLLAAGLCFLLLIVARELTGI